MPHEVETMMYVGQTPWHELGTKLDAAPTTAEAIRHAGLDWQVGPKPLQTTDGEPVPARATYRVSDGTVLGVVGPNWHPLQNTEAFAWFDPFLATRAASLETAGSLRGGKRVWVLARLNRDPLEVVKGDAVVKYLMLSNAHDGTLAVRVGFTPIRVVCANTLAAAHQDGASRLIRVMHSRRVRKAIEALRDAINIAERAFEATGEQYRYLAAHQVRPGDLERYVKVVFRAREKKIAAEAQDFARLMGQDVAARDQEDPTALLGRKSKYLGRIQELFESGAGNAMPGVRGSWWAAYNAVTHYTTHERGRSPENRLAANLAGDLPRRALQVATSLAATVN